MYFKKRQDKKCKKKNLEYSFIALVGRKRVGWRKYTICGNNSLNISLYSQENFPLLIELHKTDLHICDTFGRVYCCLIKKFTAELGAPVAQWVKRWPTDLVVPSLSLIKLGSIAHSLSLVLIHLKYF